MDMISLLGLDATTACVTAFVLALGVLWMYVMFAPPSGSAREYERLEQLLSDDPAKKAALKTTPGKREAKKGKGKGRAVSWYLYAMRSTLYSVTRGAHLLEMGRRLHSPVFRLDICTL